MGKAPCHEQLGDESAKDAPQPSPMVRALEVVSGQPPRDSTPGQERKLKCKCLFNHIWIDLFGLIHDPAWGLLSFHKLALRGKGCLRRAMRQWRSMRIGPQR